MKLLIGYDGSRSAEEALDGLRFAGLPNDAEATILSVAETWLAPEAMPEARAWRGSASGRAGAVAEPSSEENGEAGAGTLCTHAKRKIDEMFPDWSSKTVVRTGSPAKEILTIADEISPDLIAVGSHGMSSLGRLLLGSISQKVLAEAECSVRIGRPVRDGVSDEINLVIGFDGSPGSDGAVRAVAERRWTGRCRIFLVTATGTLAPTSIGRFIPPVANWIEEEKQTERRMVEQLAREAISKLNGAGCAVELIVRSGNPKQVLIKEADRLDASCIFLGAHSYESKLERFLIGSTSSAVAARAGCPVEVVRIGQGGK